MVKETIESILEVLIKLKADTKQISQEKIADEACFDSAQIAAPLKMLVDLGIVIKHKVENGYKYSLIKNPKAIHLAKTAQLGVNLNNFDSFFKISQEEKDLALNLSANSDKMRTLDVSKRKVLIQKRAYYNIQKYDEVAETLIVLLEAANNTLYEYLEKLAEKDDALKLLLDMHAQAESASHNYIEGLK
jgi:hypothetical protein